MDRFLEETGYLEDDNILLLMAYGSRITNTEKANSDFDIFMVTENKRYLSTKMIDGIKVEIHAFPLNEVKRGLIYSKVTGRSFFKSILKTGKVLKDDMDFYEQLCHLPNAKEKRNKKISYENLAQLEHYIYAFKNQNEQFVSYFLALESLRRIYHTIEDCSSIPVDKVYDLYQNKKLAEEKYCIKLPSESFRTKYIESIIETDRSKKQTNLDYFQEELRKVSVKETESNEFLSKQEIKQKLITLNNHVIKCEDMLLEQHPYANALYYITIGNIMEASRKIETNQENLNYFYNLSTIAVDTDSKIHCLEDLFCTLDANYRLDYDNFYLPLSKK